MTGKHTLIVIGTATVSLGIGVASGFFFARKQLEEKYEKLSKQEIAEAKKFYSVLHKKGAYETPESAVKSRLGDATEALTTYQGLNDDHQERVTVDENIFANPPPILKSEAFDYDEEVKHRSVEAPYILSKEEFFQDELEHEQNTLTYYEGDEVLADDRDDILDDVDMMVGLDNLQRFGYGSGDNNIVYIRNEKLMQDFEVIRSKGKYSEEVAGFDSEKSDDG